MTRTVVAVFMALLAGVGVDASPTSWARPYLDRPIPEGGVIGPDDPWVVLHDELEVEPGASGGIAVTHRAVWAPRGAGGRALTLRFPYDAVEDELLDPAIWIVGGARRTAVKIPRSSTDTAVIESGVHVGSGRSLVVTTRPVAPGERVIVSWTRIGFRDDGAEGRIWLLGPAPILELVARSAPGIEMLWIRPNGTESPGVQTGDFRTSDLPAVGRVYPDGDPSLPDPASALPHVIVRRTDAGPWQWSAIAARAAGWYDETPGDDDARILNEVVADTIGDATDPGERATRLAAFVQALRYRAESWGTGAHKPESPAETLRTGVGDCKAKSRLLRELLRRAGIESVPLYAWSGGRFADPPPVPSALWFDHVVLAVRLAGAEGAPAALTEGPGAGWLLFDPTYRLTPFGAAPPHLEGSTALWLSRSGGTPFRIATVSPGVDASSVALAASIRDDGSLDLDLDVEGHSALLLHLTGTGAARSGAAILADEVEALLRPAVPDIAVESARWRELGEADARVTVGLGVRARVAGSLVPLGGERLGLAAPPALVRTALDVPAASGSLPAGDTDLDPVWSLLGCGQPLHLRERAELLLSLPDGWRVVGGPQWEASGPSWRISSTLAGSRWSVELELQRGRFEQDVCDRRDRDLATLARLLRQPLIVERAGR